MKIFKFIEEHIDLIDENKFQELYDILVEESPDFIEIGCLTNALTDAGINPLDYLNEIPAGYLYACEDVTSFEIPKHIKTIGISAFADTSIEKLIIPEGITEIEEGAFSWNPKLIKIVLPSSLKRLGVECFEGCENLHTIDYNGTKAQWQRMDKFVSRIVNSYKANTLNTINCSDGELDIP